MGSIEKMYAMINKKEHKTNIPVPPPPPERLTVDNYMNLWRPLPPIMSPRKDILGKADYFKICVPLYEACMNGNWKAAKDILDDRPELVHFAITENLETPLHVAVSAEENKQTEQFVKNLVDLMDDRELEFQNKGGNTALCLASAAGNIKMVMTMVNKNPGLLNIPGSQRMMPLYMSALYGKYNTVNYLYDNSQKMTGKNWTHQNRGWVLLKCVEWDFFDVALKIVKDRPELVSNGYVFGALARKHDAFNGVEQSLFTRIINLSKSFGSQLFLRGLYAMRGEKMGVEGHYTTDALKFLRISLIKTIRKMSKEEVDDIVIREPRSVVLSNGMSQNSSKVLFVAAEMGNTVFVVELLRAYPDLIWHLNDDNYSIFHVAVMNRHQDVYNLLYEIGSMKDMITTLVDQNGNNMLHLVGTTSRIMRSYRSGASLLMQRELSWFKEVEKMIPPTLRARKNNAGHTPYDVFFQNNKDLLSQCLKWTKDGMLVATLIITVAFAVAFTVPGGYNDHGSPHFIHKHSFLIFVVADAISLFSSTTSLLVFLSILTSRHSPRTFMFSLPRKLMIGQIALFISVAAMMVTFSASFFVLYHKRLTWVPNLIATFAAIPVIVFAVLQFPLLVDMFRSIHDSHNLFRPKKRMLYNTNPWF
ncbi:Ankyrin repeat-containing protein [Artemisia annua]|uniref:Ankyrin repeat-containing protein n=1 Tax=Artemisia annua TaxID=35608 RepID=A0A2U1NEX8_ARTAN|nr:Ankyrin repeat-containing protein [Artemisia annua]